MSAAAALVIGHVTSGSEDICANSQVIPDWKMERASEVYTDTEEPDSARRKRGTAAGGQSQAGEHETLGFVAEYARSSRSTCRQCKQGIEENELRLGRLVPNPRYQKEPMANW